MDDIAESDDSQSTMEYNKSAASATDDSSSFLNGGEQSDDSEERNKPSGDKKRKHVEINLIKSPYVCLKRLKLSGENSYKINLVSPTITSVLQEDNIMTNGEVNANTQSNRSSASLASKPTSINEFSTDSCENDIHHDQNDIHHDKETIKSVESAVTTEKERKLDSTVTPEKERERKLKDPTRKTVENILNVIKDFVVVQSRITNSLQELKGLASNGCEDNTGGVDAKHRVCMELGLWLANDYYNQYTIKNNTSWLSEQKIHSYTDARKQSKQISMKMQKMKKNVGAYFGVTQLKSKYSCKKCDFRTNSTIVLSQHSSSCTGPRPIIIRRARPKGYEYIETNNNSQAANGVSVLPEWAREKKIICRKCGQQVAWSNTKQHVQDCIIQSKRLILPNPAPTVSGPDPSYTQQPPPSMPVPQLPVYVQPAQSTSSAGYIYNTSIGRTQNTPEPRPTITKEVPTPSANNSLLSDLLQMARIDYLPQQLLYFDACNPSSAGSSAALQQDVVTINVSTLGINISGFHYCFVHYTIQTEDVLRRDCLLKIISFLIKAKPTTNDRAIHCLLLKPEHMTYSKEIEATFKKQANQRAQVAPTSSAGPMPLTQQAQAARLTHVRPLSLGTTTIGVTPSRQQQEAFILNTLLPNIQQQARVRALSSGGTQQPLTVTLNPLSHQQNINRPAFAQVPTHYVPPNINYDYRTIQPRP